MLSQTVIGARWIVHLVLLHEYEISSYFTVSAMNFLCKLARLDVLIQAILSCCLDSDAEVYSVVFRWAGSCIETVE